MKSAATRPVVGIVGLGIMGATVSLHLLEQGFTVIGYDILDSACPELTEHGGHKASSPAEVAEQAEIVLTLLPSASAFNDVLFGRHGLAGLSGKERIIVDMSTLDPNTKKEANDRLDASRVTLLDCPISGTGAQAKNKDIVIFGSGPRLAYDRCVPVFQAMSRSQFYLGDFGNGTKMKLIANLLVAIHNVATAEAVVLARKAGIDPDLMIEVVGGGAGGSRMLTLRGPMMSANVYDPASMKLSVWQKDMTIIREFVAGLSSPTLLFDVSDRLYTAANALCSGQEDTAAVCRVIEQMAGMPAKEST